MPVAAWGACARPSLPRGVPELATAGCLRQGDTEVRVGAAAGLRYHERVDAVGSTRALRRLGYLPRSADLELVSVRRGGMAAEARLAAAGNWTPATAAYWAAIVRECGGGGGRDLDSSSEESSEDSGESDWSGGHGGGPGHRAGRQLDHPRSAAPCRAAPLRVSAPRRVFACPAPRLCLPRAVVPPRGNGGAMRVWSLAAASQTHERRCTYTLCAAV